MAADPEAPQPSAAAAWAEARTGADSPSSAIADWKKELPSTSAVAPLQVLGFSLGTVMNDACASCWFNFLFVFLERVQGLNGAQVGVVFLTGQLCDAISTPIIGTLADRAQGLRFLGLGRRQIFYFFGCLIVALSFVFVFAVCLPVRG